MERSSKVIVALELSSIAVVLKFSRTIKWQRLIRDHDGHVWCVTSSYSSWHCWVPYLSFLKWTCSCHSSFIFLALSAWKPESKWKVGSKEFLVFFFNSQVWHSHRKNGFFYPSKKRKRRLDWIGYSHDSDSSQDRSMKTKLSRFTLLLRNLTKPLNILSPFGCYYSF